MNGEIEKCIDHPGEKAGNCGRCASAATEPPDTYRSARQALRRRERLTTRPTAATQPDTDRADTVRALIDQETQP